MEPLPQTEDTPEQAFKPGFIALPDWLSKPVIVTPETKIPFANLELDQRTLRVLEENGYHDAFAVQAAVLPLLLRGNKQAPGDVCISASTGSGKTLAYALPMVMNLHDKPLTRLRGLVVVPTRELVMQAQKVLQICCSRSKLKVGTAVGNVPLREERKLLVEKVTRYDPQALTEITAGQMDEDDELMNWDSDDVSNQSSEEEPPLRYIADYASKVDILICTPGRLVDHLQRSKGFHLNDVQWLVVDEADRLLEDSFQEWVDIVIPELERLPPPDLLEDIMSRTFHQRRTREIQKVILSATMTKDVSKLKSLELRKPSLVMLRGRRSPVSSEAGLEDEREMAGEVEGVELPPRLHEISVQVKDEENKPLYLLELIRSKKAMVSEVTPSTSSDSESASSIPSSPSFSDSSASSKNVSKQSTKAGLNHRKILAQTTSTLIFASSTSSAHRLSRLIGLLDPALAANVTTLTKASSSATIKLLGRLETRSRTTAPKHHIIISTDRASRGLDIPNLTHVINYDMPSSVNSYVHRVGRTARAGNEGRATTLVGWSEGRWFWNEIARSLSVRRGRDMKVRRREVKPEGFDMEEKQKYAEALRTIGEESRAEGRVRDRL